MIHRLIDFLDKEEPIDDVESIKIKRSNAKKRKFKSKRNSLVLEIPG